MRPLHADATVQQAAAHPAGASPSVSAPRSDVFRAHAVRGTLLASLGQFVALVLRLVSNLTLTHLLEPDAFGLMAIVLAVTTGLQLISDVGVWQAIVRSPRGDDPDFLNTAWTINIARGAALWVVGWAVAWPAAKFYDRSELLWLLPLCSTQAVIQGLESTKAITATRHMHVGRVVALDLCAQIVGFAVAVGVGLASRSVHALALAALSAMAVRVAVGHLWLPGMRNRLRWDRQALQEVLSFGSWIFVSTLMFFAGTRWDVFALGRMEGMGLLGVYGLAQLITQIPVQLGERVAGFVLMPALAASFRTDPHAFADDVRRARQLILPAAAVLFLGAAMAAPAFFRLYRDAYADAGWIAQLLVVVGWCGFLQDTSSRALVALGDSRSLALANAARLVATVTCSALGFHFAALPGFVLGNGLGALAGTVVVGATLSLRGIAVLAADMAATVAFGGVLAAVCGVPRVVAWALSLPWEFVTLGAMPLFLVPALLWLYRHGRRALRAR